MFMTVKYGEGEQKFFNLDCRTILLLQCIKEKCDSSNEGSIDLADEAGEVMFLNERKDHYSSEFLKARGVYILIRREKCDKNYPIYTPLLNDKKTITDDFMKCLNLIRERAIRQDEDQRLIEAEKCSNGKGKHGTIGKKINKDTININLKRSQSQTLGNAKKTSTRGGRPSR